MRVLHFFFNWPPLPLPDSYRGHHSQKPPLPAPRLLTASIWTQCRGSSLPQVRCHNPTSVGWSRKPSTHRPLGRWLWSFVPLPSRGPWTAAPDSGPASRPSERYPRSGAAPGRFALRGLDRASAMFGSAAAAAERRGGAPPCSPGCAPLSARAAGGAVRRSTCVCASARFPVRFSDPFSVPAVAFSHPRGFQAPLPRPPAVPPMSPTPWLGLTLRGYLLISQFNMLEIISLSLVSFLRSPFPPQGGEGIRPHPLLMLSGSACARVHGFRSERDPRSPSDKRLLPQRPRGQVRAFHGRATRLCLRSSVLTAETQSWALCSVPLVNPCSLQ